jgi:hypothetical protein
MNYEKTIIAIVFFEFLHDVKKINPSTNNNYRSAPKFIKIYATLALVKIISFSGC